MIRSAVIWCVIIQAVLGVPVRQPLSGLGRHHATKGQPPGNLFYRCPRRASYQVNQLLSDMNQRGESSPTRPLPLLLAVRLFLTAKKKGTLSLIPSVSFAAAYQLPSDSFTCNVQFCVGFKGNLTYIQTRKWIKCCCCSLSLSFRHPPSVSKA